MSGNAYRISVQPTAGGHPFGDPEAAVYVLEPELLHCYGVTTHVIVARTRTWFPATDVFPCSEDGELADWAPIGGSHLGRVSHPKALRFLGYEVVANVRP